MLSALKSLFGLSMASPVPHTLSRLKPQAHLQLFLATRQVTMHRMIDTYPISHTCTGCGACAILRGECRHLRHPDLHRHRRSIEVGRITSP